MRRSQQVKKIIKLVGTTCERQFSKKRPALLWLHLQGLQPKQIDRESEASRDFFERFAQHAFASKRREHMCSIIFSSDTEIEHQRIPLNGKKQRYLGAEGRLRGFDNLRCRFGNVLVLSPELEAQM
jgi:hypothetical protein